VVGDKANPTHGGHRKGSADDRNYAHGRRCLIATPLNATPMLQMPITRLCAVISASAY
jgi:hypothetical protein